MKKAETKTSALKQALIAGSAVGISLLMNGGTGYALNSQSAMIEMQRFEEESATRLAHAHELLGKNYAYSVVRTGEHIGMVSDFIHVSTLRELHGHWKPYSKLVAQTIMEQAHLYGFDPVFLMAVIENESSFNPSIVGSHGEIGLMQITPVTAEWISEKYGVTYKGKASLYDPIINIKIGSAYLSFLREKFNFHSKLYLAAYNMGVSNVHRALGHNVTPQGYANRVMKRYISFYSQMKSGMNQQLKSKKLVALSNF
jgi:soluble lytic murein transglycosylase